MKMVTAKKSTHTSRGLKQDRALVAGEQAHEVKYAAKKAGSTTGVVKNAIKTVGNSRKAVAKAVSKK
jgi:hypothetical protein